MQTLRDYQGESMAELRRAVGELRRAEPNKPARVVLVLPTGAGKTTVGTAIAEGAVQRGHRVVVLVHRVEILDQWVARLSGAGLSVGVVAAGRAASPDRLVQVAMVDTVRARGTAPDAEIAIVDECHHTAAATWGRVVSAYSDAVAIVGLTATPARGDGKGLRSQYDRLIQPCRIERLVREGWLLPVRVYGPGERTSTLARDPVDAYQTWCAGRRAIVFAATIEQSRDIAARLTDAGVPAEHIDGDVPDDERAAIMGRLRAGATMVVTNVGLLGEGVDVPGVSSVLLARGVGSQALYLQAVGRAMRPRNGRAEPGEHAVLVDLCGSTHECGHPEEARTYDLDGGVTRAGEAERIALRTCPACLSVARAGEASCPMCGAQYPRVKPPKVRRRELTEIERNANRRLAEEMPARWATWRSYVRACAADGQPISVAVARYRDRWGDRPLRAMVASATRLLGGAVTRIDPTTGARTTIEPEIDPREGARRVLAELGITPTVQRARPGHRPTAQRQ